MLFIRLDRRLTLSHVPESLSGHLRERLRFLNPRWRENDKRGRWNRDTPKYLNFLTRKDDGRLLLPRGCLRPLILTCRRMGIPHELDDRRRSPDPVSFSFSGTLKPFQQTAADRMLSKEFGTLSAPTGAGKTVIALYMIASRKLPALVMVHTRELAFQWMDRIRTFLGIPEDEIGMVGNGRFAIGEKITVGMVQTLYKKADQVSPRIGHLVVDECHRTPSRTFTDAVGAFDARYLLGLSATPWRRDKLDRLITWHLGDIHHEIPRNALVRDGHILAPELVVRETGFLPFHDPVEEYGAMIGELIADDGRNRLIARDVAEELQRPGAACLVLSDRKQHCETLHSLLRFGHHVTAELLTGDMAPAERREALARIESGESRVLVATGQLIGEGLDSRKLSTLFMATPVRFHGRLIQYLGRILRPAEGKRRARVFDYVDSQVGLLKNSFLHRRKVYEQAGDRSIPVNPDQWPDQ